MQTKLINPTTREVIRESTLKTVIRKLLSIETKKPSQLLYRVIYNNVTLYVGYDSFVEMGFVYEQNDGAKFLVATVDTKTQFVTPVTVDTLSVITEIAVQLSKKRMKNV